MATTQTEHRPSINIIRDSDISFDYLPTPNAKSVFSQLISATGSGRKSFNIIGAYGTGKSSFLWAFERTLCHGEEIFSADVEVRLTYHAIKLVGEYHSFTQALATELELDWTLELRPRDIIKALDKRCIALEKEGQGLLFMVDEFGKYLEFAAKNDPDGELYFLQMLAEFFNDPQKNALFITTLHQDFSAYSLGLTRHQREEWGKVKGRFKELVFNEPVEQLLLLASERLKDPGSKISNRGPKSPLFKAIEGSKAFPLRDYFTKEIAHNLLPLDILSAGILTLSLQKFGQNQRSLFSFLESNDHLGLEEFKANPSAPHYSLSHVFDYLQFNHKGVLSSKYNPEHIKWSNIKSAIERVEALDAEDSAQLLEVVKVVGMLHLFAPEGAVLNQQFLETYLEKSVGLTSPSGLISILTDRKIIRYSSLKKRFLPFEGTDVDIELAIDGVGNLVEQVTELVPLIHQEFTFPYVLAKELFFETGTPRIFSYQLTDDPLEEVAVTNSIDGIVNLVLSERLSKEDLLEKSHISGGPIIYGLYQNTDDIARVLLEIRKIRRVIADHPNDRIAQRELGTILESQKRLLGHYVLGNHFGESANVFWCYNGEELAPSNAKAFNRVLSKVGKMTYPHTPVLRNEMMNRSKPSGSINTARNRLVGAVLQNWSSENLGFDENRFPPEKTIYLSLLKETGIHRHGEEGYGLHEPVDDTWSPLWESGKEFISSTKNSKRNLGELVQIWKSPPFKLKQGFVDFWMPIFLYISKDEYALFSDGKYIPNMTEDVLQLIHKAPRKYEIKAFNTGGVHWKLFNQYRSFLQLSGIKEPGSQSLIETIKPFLVFYHQLPEYAKTTKQNLNPQTIQLRDAIAKAKDPEILFFETFPRVMGISMTELQKDDAKLTEYIDTLKECIRDLRTAYIRLLDRYEEFLSDEILGVEKEFSVYQKTLQKRLMGMRKRFVRKDLKVLLQRINSPLDDRDSWLASLGQAIVGKSMDRFSDEDEKQLFTQMGLKLDELFGLQDLSLLAEDDEDEVYRIDLLTPGEEKETQVIRIGSKNQSRIQELTERVEAVLNGADRSTILAILSQYLKKARRRK